MSNPYASPAEPNLPSLGDKPLPPPQEPGLVGQVRIVAILMMVQGVLDVLMGIFFVGLGAFMGTFMRQAMQEAAAEAQQPGAPSPEVMAGFMTGFYAVIGVVLVIIGGLNMYAGYRNYHFQSRVLGILSLAAGVGTILGCYCAPTSIALCVYGLIVYLNRPVANAFQMAAEGYPGDAIIATFSKYRYEQHQANQVSQ